MSWLDQHLEEFVRPQLGYIPDVDPANEWIRKFNRNALIALNRIWRQTKVLAAGRTILLPGRDVFLFEVLARMLDDYPTIFRPDISSAVAPYVAEDYTKTFVLDTGYKGSIPKAMSIPNWALVCYNYASKDNLEHKAKRQVFPKTRSGTYTTLSSYLEGCPKYWTRGAMAANESKCGGTIVQRIDPTNMKSAAMLTIRVAKSIGLLKPRIRRRPKVLSQGRLL